MYQNDLKNMSKETSNTWKQSKCNNRTNGQNRPKICCMRALFLCASVAVRVRLDRALLQKRPKPTTHFHVTHHRKTKYYITPATRYNTLQHTATCCNMLQQHNSSPAHIQYSRCTFVYVARLQQTATTATHCNTLQHTATHCNTPQYTATHRNRQHDVASS